MKAFIKKGFVVAGVLTAMMPGGILSATQAKSDKTIHVVFRYDDFSAKSPTQTELKIIQAFQRKQAALTVGVIPFVCTGNQHDPSPQDTLALPPHKTRILKKAVQQGVVDVALHGYSHQTHQAGFLSEFAGADYPTQLKKLERAKRYLEKITQTPVNTFVPPWNRYDGNTLRALEKLQFKTLSASENEPSSERSGLKFLPFSVGLPHLRDAVQAARASHDAEPMLVVLFHGYDFESSQDSRAHMTFEEFTKLLNWLSAQQDVQMLSVSQAAHEIEDLGATRYAANKRHNILSSLLPAPLRSKPSQTTYRETQVVTKTQWKVMGFYLGIVVLAVTGSFLTAKHILPRSASARRAVRLSGLALVVGLAIFVFHDLETSMKGLMITSLAVGVFIGTLFPSFEQDRL